MTEHDLQKFCSKDPLKKEMMGLPFRQDGFTWATNGWVAIGVPALFGVMGNAAAPPVMSIRPKTEPAEWFDLPAVEVETCEWCNGKVTDYICHECKGRGRVTLRNEYTVYYDIECGGCDGEGKVMHCPKCSGTGMDAEGFVKINGVDFRPNALWLIRDLPRVQISPTGPTSPAFLRFDGEGVGFLMPGKRREPEEPCAG